MRSIVPAMRKPLPFVAQFLLFVAFACLVIIDASILPLAFLIIFLGTAFASAGIGVMVPAAIFFLVLGAGLVSITFLVGRTLFRRVPL